MDSTMIKTSLGFAATCFGLQIFFLFIVQNFFGVYTGDSFTIVWLYIFNLVVALVLFPAFAFFLHEISIRHRMLIIVLYFLWMWAVINLVPLIAEQLFYTGHLIRSLFTSAERRAAVWVELINPVISFSIAYLIFRRSRLWIGE